MELYQDKVKKALDRAVQAVYGNPIATYMGADKTPENVRIRHIIINLFKEETGVSMHEVERVFNVGYHRVVYAVQRAEDSMKYDKIYSKNFVSLREQFQKFINL